LVSQLNSAITIIMCEVNFLCKHWNCDKITSMVFSQSIS